MWKYPIILRELVPRIGFVKIISANNSRSFAAYPRRLCVQNRLCSWWTIHEDASSQWSPSEAVEQPLRCQLTAPGWWWGSDSQRTENKCEHQGKGYRKAFWKNNKYQQLLFKGSIKTIKDKVFSQYSFILVKLRNKKSFVILKLLSK